MRRFLLLGLLTLGGLILADTSAHAWGSGMQPGVGGGSKRIGRVHGFWLNPSAGRLKDYSSYFAHKYPWLPGAAEYQYNPYAQQGYGQMGSSLPQGARILSVTPAKPAETVEPPKKQ
jgi:hypothetical protein